MRFNPQSMRRSTVLPVSGNPLVTTETAMPRLAASEHTANRSSFSTSGSPPSSDTACTPALDSLSTTASFWSRDSSACVV